MSRLADPTICPDCRALLADSVCTGCGLGLAGEPGQRLWQAMLTADRMVEEIRARSTSAPSRLAALAPQEAGPAAPLADDRGPEERREGRATRLEGPSTPRLPAFSVPVILLSLGGLFLLVAAVVFVAITWGALGLAGRTLVLLGVTGLFAGLATTLTRRGLRGAAETLWTVALAMLAVDLFAGHGAGLPGLSALGDRGITFTVGAVLLASGAGVTLWARRTTTARLLATEILALLGVLLMTSALAWTDDDAARGASIAVPLLAVGGLLGRRHLRVVGTGALVIGVLTWLQLALIGLGRAVEDAAWTTWWADLRGWPLLVAAAYAGALTTRRATLPLARRGRTAAAIAALVPLIVLANAPWTTQSPTRDTLVAAATLATLAALTQLKNRRDVATAHPKPAETSQPRTPELPVWSVAAAVVGAFGASVATLVVIALPWGVAIDQTGSRSATATLPSIDSGVAGWAWVALAVAAALVPAASARLVRSAHRPALLVTALAVVVAGVVLGVLALRPVLVVGVAVTLAAAVLLLALAWWQRDERLAAALAGLAAGYAYLLARGLALPSDLMSALTATTAAVLLAAVLLASARRDATLAPAMAGALGALAASDALASWAQVGAVSDRTQAFALAALAVALLLVAAPAGRRTTGREALEIGAIVPAALAWTLAPTLDSSPWGPDRAAVLTILGCGVAAWSILHDDRRHLSWLATVVLGGATLMRVALDVSAPELYTLPAAVLLLGVGLHRLRTRPAMSSVDALGSGLTLALLPSLLLALGDPISLRGALVAVGSLAVLAYGVWARLSAPLLAGAGAAALLAVRELEPVAEALPRWVSLATVGVVLLAVGISWEARLRNLRAAGRYLADLR